MLSRLRIGPKLLLAPALVLLLLLVSSGAAYWAMLRQNQSLETIVQVRAARIHAANTLAADAQAAHAMSYQLLTWISASVAPARVDALEAEIQRRHAALTLRFAQLGAASIEGSVERALLIEAAAAHARHVRAVREVIELAGGDQSVAASAMVKAEQAFAREALPLAALARREQRQSEAAAQRAAAEFGLLRWLMPALAALSVLLSLAVTLAVRRALLREVGGIGQSARDLASGNLTVAAREYGRDEISDTSRTLDASIRTLNGTLKEILASARAIEAQAGGMSDVSCAIVQMDHMTAENSALVQEAAAAAASLQSQAISLSLAVAAFTLDDGVKAEGKPKLWLASRRE